MKPAEPGSLIVFGFADEHGAFALRDLTLPAENEARLRQWIADETSHPPSSPTVSAASASPP